ncbi:MAG: hypothetical protein JKY11_06640 [Alphaproteobacteria bacterium]|nr:hypothetical protein [Alphaproteobacteria bacterium]
MIKLFYSIVVSLFLIGASTVIQQNAHANGVCARGYIKAIRVHHDVVNRNKINMAVHIDGNRFRAPDITDNKHFSIDGQGRKWVQIEYGRLTRFSAFFEVLAKAHVSGAPVSIFTRQSGNNTYCMEDGNKFEIQVCTNERDCNN